LHGFLGPLGLKWRFWGAKLGKVWCDADPQLTHFYLWGFLHCANFSENRSRNATVRVRMDGYTDKQTQTGFIICLMLYAIAMGQITIQQTL